MLCPECRRENPDSASFCRACGFTLQVTCPQCGQSLEPDDAFCISCGTRVKRPPITPDVATSYVGVETPAQKQSSDELHTSLVNERYQVKQLLGEGGKKRVYLAHDTLLDREVAFALIKTEGLDEVSRSRVTHEAQAMGRLGSHPHIVTVFDLGEYRSAGSPKGRSVGADSELVPFKDSESPDQSDLGSRTGQPYIVTELMQGGDVQSLLENSPDHRLPLKQALDIANALCSGLEFSHSRGIIHRDLKPSNVWLTEDGTAKIGDFGLSLSLDRSRLTQEGMIVGTVAYIAPEQAVGGDVTHLADLYTLGAMLYEMITGRPPFLGDDSVAIISQHINTAPVAPTWHNTACPKPLETLVLKLLAKDPTKRPQSAAEVLAVLQSIDAETSLTAISRLGKEREDSAEAPNALDSLAGGVFVGRQQEMQELKTALDDALSGRGRMVTLVGEAGIGKTRMAQELATYARLRGAQVLWSRCHETGGAPPYWPWVQAIRSYVRERDAATIQSDMGTGAADIAEIVSDIHEKLPNIEPHTPLEPEQERFRLFDSVMTFLHMASQRQTLMIVIDDLHWADRPSLMLLHFVARELGNSRLLLVGAYRDAELSRRHPLTQTISELIREFASGGFRRVHLRGLTQENVGRFIEVTSGVTPPSSLVEAVFNQTEGNPFYVNEVVRLLVQEGELTPEHIKNRSSWSVRIPQGVRDIIGRRLDRLSENCNQVLTLAAVIGREFGLDQLAGIADDHSEDRVLELLEEGLAARVVEEVPDAVSRYQFTHALIRDTLLDELSITRRVRIHSRIAQTLEELYGEDAEAHAAELTYHFEQAETVLGGEKLVKYAMAAGERALSRYAHEDALGYFQRALAAKEGQDMDAEKASIMFGLGRAQAANAQRQQFEKAFANIGQALEYYLSVNDVERAVSVAEYPVPPRMGLKGISNAIARVLELVPPDSLEAGRLLARLGWVLGVSEGDYDRAQEAFRDALAIARREEDSRLELRTLAYASRVDVYELRWKESLEKSLQAMELARRVDDLRAQIDSRYWTAFALHVLGDSEGAKLHASAVLDLAGKVRDRYWQVTSLWLNEIIARLEGDWQSAREFNDRGLSTWPNDPRLLGTRVVLEYELGEFEKGSLYLNRLLEAMRLTAPGATLEHANVAWVVPAIARISGVNDRLDIGVQAAEAVLSSHSATAGLIRYAAGGLALLAAIGNDRDAANEQSVSLASANGTMLFSALAGDRLLGFLSSVQKQFEEATERFESAILFCENAGYLPELAWTYTDYAQSLLQRNRADDRDKMASLLEKASAIASKLGMKPLEERITALSVEAEATPTKAPKYPDGLTNREVEVIRLIAAGKTNREIGEELYISLRTVANHVTNILNKTGAANRAEAASYTARHGLL